MKRISAIILSVAAAFTMLCTSVGAAESTTPSGIAFDEIGTKIEEFEKENEGSYASFATAVFSGDEVLYSMHFGYIDRENQIAADENSVYEWGSVSKMLIWVSAMQLYEQGKLDLNADIRTYLPDGFFRKLKYDEPITMLNLMNHNAGWQETVGEIETANEADIPSLEDALKACEPAQVFKPGEITAYSNYGAALAGYIVERISGMDYVEYLHKNVLEPLGMEHTSVGADYKDNEWVWERHKQSKGYLILKTGGYDLNQSLGSPSSYIMIYPAGSATGTLADLTTFAQAFVDDNCPLFEKQETLDLLLSASDFYGDSDVPKNCHGLWPSEYAVRVMGHGGNTSLGSANLLFDRESKMGVVVMANQMGESLFCYGIPKLVFGGIENNPIFKNASITESGNNIKINGNFVATRGFFAGPLKLYSCIANQQMDNSENSNIVTSAGEPLLIRFADNFYRLTDTNDILYCTTAADGMIILEAPISDYMQYNAVTLELIAVIVFAVLIIITIVLLIVKGIRKLAKKYKKIPAGKAILAGQLAKLLPVAALVILALVRVGSFTLTALCIAAALGAVVCLIAAVFTAKAAFTEKEMKLFTRIRYLVSVLANLFVVGFVVYSQLFNFMV